MSKFSDINLDGMVDGLDIAVLLASWGDGSSNADVDLNGVVDGLDLAILLASWGTL